MSSFPLTNIFQRGSNHILTLAPCLIELDLLVLQSDYSWILNPSIPAEASSMIRLVGSRVPITQANQLVAIAAASRPTSNRPVNMLIYFRGLAMAQALAEIELTEAMPRQNAANPLGGQRRFQGVAGLPPIPAGGTIGPNSYPGVVHALDGLTILRVTSDGAASAALERNLADQFFLCGNAVSLDTECQIECEKICQIECQKICQIECQKICQIECQKICQIIRKPEHMPEDMPDRYARRYAR